MPKFKLRLWQEQRLYDCDDYEVDAPTVEEAARRLLEMHEAVSADDGNGVPPMLHPTGVRSLDRHTIVHALDPQEIIDGDIGVCTIDDNGDKIADVDVELGYGEDNAAAVRSSGVDD